jgi:hypothetical protein
MQGGTDNGILIYRVVQIMDLIKNLLESQTLFCRMIIGLKKNECGRICVVSYFNEPK